MPRSGQEGIQMAVTVPNGSIVAIENGSADPVVLNSITNANPALGTTAAAHGMQPGDFFEVVSGWARINNRIFRVLAAPTTTTFTFEGLDTTNQTIYPAGGGGGTIAKINGFTQLAQILNSSSSGGEQQFLEYQLLEADSQQRIPTFKNAAGLSFTVADDPNLPGYKLASTANEDRLPRAVRVSLPKGSVLLYNAYISISPIPTLTVNEIMSVEVSLSLLNGFTRY